MPCREQGWGAKEKQQRPHTLILRERGLSRGAFAGGHPLRGTSRLRADRRSQNEMKKREPSSGTSRSVPQTHIVVSLRTIHRVSVPRNRQSRKGAETRMERRYTPKGPCRGRERVSP